jgi:serine protease Do
MHQKKPDIVFLDKSDTGDIVYVEPSDAVRYTDADLAEAIVFVEKKMNRNLVPKLIVAFVAIAFLATAIQAMVSIPDWSTNEPAASPVTPSIQWNTPEAECEFKAPIINTNLAAAGTSHESIAAAKSLSNAFRQVSRSVLPSIVAIENKPLSVKAEQYRRGPATQPNPFQGTPLEKYFGNQIPHGYRGTPGMPGPPRGGVGSGVIVDASGLILTNNHVVAAAGEVNVRLNDGREFIAEQVWTDPKTDIAIIKISASQPLQAATIGNSDETQVGDWVVAIGQPFGLESTVTAGIISAKSRAMGITDREDFIQTDAAINPGNSGGPLVNLDGQVIGINTAISSRGGGNDGVGFAIPINLAKWVADELVEDGAVQRAFLGVGIQPITQQLAAHFNVPPRTGLLISHVQPDSPADRAGLKTGDILIEFDGQAINAPHKLQTVVERSQVGNQYKMTVLRDEKKIELTYVAEEAEAAMPIDLWAGTADQPQESVLEKIGLQVEAVDAEIARRLKLDSTEGVVVTQVRAGSVAAGAGLRPGMVIVEVDRNKIASLEDFEAAISEADTDAGVLMLVRTREGSRYLVVNE